MGEPHNLKIFDFCGAGVGLSLRVSKMRERWKKEERAGKSVEAFLGEDVQFDGVLNFQGVMRVDGKMKGEIHSKDTLIVGEKAVLNVNVDVGRLVIYGKILGNVTTTGKIELYSKGRLYGNVKTPLLFVEEGAVFKGNCDMDERGPGEGRRS